MAESKRLRLLASSALFGFALAVGGASFAAAQDNGQDDTAPDLTAPGAQPAAEGQERERITVTGSRLQRDEFSSISPLQTISAADARDIGITDVTQIIAQSPTIAGTQLDGTVNAGSPTAAVEGVPANGPGAATVALRGLGAERTLLLVNGRRLAPSGVRGAPVAPDLNLLPSSVIDRVEILTDGASSIYGADAVAGVANIILRKNVDGLEFNAFTTVPEQSGGEVLQVSFLGGASNDRGNFTVAGEFYNRNAVLAGDRTDWNECLKDIEVDLNTGTEYSNCQDGRPDNAVFIFSQGFVYNTPGSTDIGVPGFSTGATAAALNGVPATNNLSIYNLQDEELATQLLENLERVNLYATGEYDLNFFERDTAYFEMSYANRNSVGRFTSEQVFPAIPGQIPMETAGGSLATDGDGDLLLFDNPLNPFGEVALPVYSLQGLSQRRKTNIDSFRAVGGIEGDLPFAGLMEKNWVYDVWASYDRSQGTASQAAMSETNALIAIDTLRFDEDMNLVCGIDETGGFGFLTPYVSTDNCPIVDWFAPSLFTTQGGDKRFATQEENDFLFGNVINTTEIEQVMASALITGDVFEMPAGTVGLVLGAEFRETRIDSVNDFTRVQGTAASEIPDIEGDTRGRTSLAEFYAETEIPVIEQFTLNLSGRYTEEENFGSETTYSVKGDFRPTDWLRFRGTYGTTFRAPNLREQFLAAQAGTIGGGNDPCLVPTTANNGGVYDPSGETRPQIVLDNCVADGVDPTALGLQATTGIPTTTGGAGGTLAAETSETWTAGFVFSQPWTDAYAFDFSLTYFDIEVEDTVEELDAATILTRCYNDFANLASPFCDRVSRNTGNPSTATIANVDSSFVNLGLVTSKGYDMNVRFSDDFQAFGMPWDLALNGTATYYTEQFTQISDTDPGDDNIGEAGFPELSFLGTARLSTGNWGFTWRSRYIDDFQQDGPLTFTSANPGNACAFAGVTDVSNCVDVDYGDSVWYHDVSASLQRDQWSFRFGVSNVFDEEPPLIDQGQGPTRLNFVVQSGYDMIGRRAFVGASRRF